MTIPSLPDDYYIKGTLGRQFHEREKSELFLPDLSCAKRAGDRYGLFLWRQQDYFAQFEKEGISLKAWTFGAAYGIICGSIDMSWEGDYGWMRKKKPSLALLCLALCCLFVLIPSVCASFYFYRTVSVEMEDNAHETVGLYLNRTRESTEAVLDTLRNGIYYLMSDPTVQGYMQLDAPLDQMARSQIEKQFSRVLFLSPALSQDKMSGIYLVRENDEFIPVRQDGIYQGATARIRRVYYQLRNLNSARELYLMPGDSEHSYLLTDYLNLNTMRPIGKIIIELQTAALIDTSYIKSVYSGAEVYFSRTDGQVLYCSGSVDAPISVPAGYSGDLYHQGWRLMPYRLQLDVFVPKADIVRSLRETVTLYVGFTTAVLLLTLVIASLVYWRQLRPLRGMVDTMNRMATGDLSARMEPTSYRETELMASAFNKMAERLGSLFEEVYAKGLLLKQAELWLLESQIQPHFIFNVLEVINVRCMAAEQYELCRIVSNLANLLRANVSNRGQQKITLEEELRYVRYYLELQKERYGEKLHYEIELESQDLLRYCLPKLTIQPLVENSVVHGLENKRGGGSVRISIWEEEDEIDIRVWDNGVGFDTTNLFQTDVDEVDNQHNHVALPNVQRRIQLLYGQAYGISVTSTPGNGTTALVNLPLDRGGGEL